MGETHEQIPFVKYDADGRIDQDLPCLKCGYNLRTLRDDGQCPECGASVHESARLAWLCQHDRVWLRKLAGSTVWIGIAMICFVSFLSVGLLLAVSYHPPDEVVGVVGVAVAVVGGLVTGLLGFWQITAPHRGGGIRRGRVRRIARWTMAAGLAGLLLELLARRIGSPRWAIDLLMTFSVVCVGVGAWATLTYAATLATKIPEARLVKQVRIVAWGFALCFALLGAGLLMNAARRLMPAGIRVATHAIPVDGTMVITTAGLLPLSVWTIPLLVWYRRRFREAAAMSQHRAHGSGR